MKNKIEKKIMLIITEECNLGCTYCYEEYKTKNIMSFETAKQILDREYSTIGEYDDLTIEFIGGEAFLEFGLIKKIYDYARELFDKEKTIFFCTTNGTLVHGEMQKWLAERKEHFICSLSLDGTKKMHDMNRPFKNCNIGSFDHIDIDFFKRTWPQQSVKMTVSEESLPFLYDGVKYVEDLGMKCVCTFATGIEWHDESVNVLIEQLDKLVAHYIKYPERQVCRLLDFNYNAIYLPIENNYKLCGAGRNLHSYDVHGNFYPCQGLSPVTLGEEEAKKYIDYDFENFSFSENNPCLTCPYIRLCRTCYASNKKSTGDVENETVEMCLFNRICMLAGSKLRYYQLKNKDISELTLEEKYELAAVLNIQENVLDEKKYIKKYTK